MSFSKEWDVIYKNKLQLSIWPWSDLVSYVNRYANPQNGYKKILELGCGAGANIPFFQSFGTKAEYYAIEGSITIVQSLHKSYPSLAKNIISGDFTEAIPFNHQFDLVVDRSSSIHNSTDAIIHTLSIIFSKLRSGGKLIGIDWFSTAHSDFEMGKQNDYYTRKDFSEHTQFNGVGIVHFCDKTHIINLLENTGFMIERLEHKENKIIIPNESASPAWWNFVAVRP